MRGFFEDDKSGARSMTRLVLFIATVATASSLQFVVYWMVRTGRDYSKAIDTLAWATVACGVGYVSKSLSGAVAGVLDKFKKGEPE